MPNSQPKQRGLKGAKLVFLTAVTLLSVACGKLDYSKIYSDSLSSTGTLSFSSIGILARAVVGFVTGQAPVALYNWQMADGFLNKPTDVAVDEPADMFYVLDGGYNRVQKFRLSTGEFVGAIGYSQSSLGTCPNLSPATGWCTGGSFSSGIYWTGSTDGTFNSASSLAIDSVHGWLFVADTGNHRIEKFNLTTGAYIGSVGNMGAPYLSSTIMKNAPQTFTLAAWFKTTTTQGGTIIGFDDRQAGQPYSNDRHIYMHPDGKLSFGIYPSGVQVTDSTAAYNDGLWHHVVGSFTANSLILYVDGAYVSSLTVGVPNAVSYTGYWRIGYGQGGWPNQSATNYFDATIDDAAIWNSVLSPADVSALYASSGLGPSSPQWSNIDSAWPLDEPSGSTHADVSGHGNALNSNGYTITGVAGTHSLGVKLATGVAASGWQSGVAYVAGAQDGMFSSPKGVAADPVSGLLYVADTGNHRISKLDLFTGAYLGSVGKTTATTGTCPASGPAGSWCTGGTFAAGAADGMFNSPSNLALDFTGSLFVSDSSNNRLLKLNVGTGGFVGAVGNLSATSGSCPASGPAGSWCTGGTFVSGTSDGTYNGVSGLSVDPANGFAYVSDTSNNRVVKLNVTTGAFLGALGNLSATSGTCPATGSATSWCTGGTFTVGANDGSFNAPNGLATSSSSLFVTDWNNGRVQKFSRLPGALVGALGTFSQAALSSWGQVSSNSLMTLGTGDGALQWVNGLATDRVHGFFYLADSGNNRVTRFVLATGAFAGAVGNLSSSSGTCPASGAAAGWCMGGVFAAGAGDGMMNGPNGITVDPDSDTLIVGDWYNNRFSKFRLSTGAYVGSIGNLTASSGSCPAAGAAPGWCTGGTFAGGGGDGMFSAPSDVTIDASRNLLFATEWSGNRVSKINLTTGAFIGAIGKLTSSTGTCPASGSAPGWCTGGTFAIGTGDGAFGKMTGLGVDPVNQRLYIQDYDSGRIVRVNEVTGLFTGAIGGLSSSTGSCPSSGAAPSWCTGGVFVSGSADGMFSYVWSNILIDQPNNLMYVGNSGNNRIDKLNLTTGAFIGSIGYVIATTGTCPSKGVTSKWCTGGTYNWGWGDGMFSFPQYLGFDANGGLIINDYSNNRIVRVSF